MCVCVCVYVRLYIFMKSIYFKNMSLLSVTQLYTTSVKKKEKKKTLLLADNEKKLFEVSTTFS